MADTPAVSTTSNTTSLHEGRLSWWPFAKRLAFSLVAVVGSVLAALAGGAGHLIALGLLLVAIVAASKPVLMRMSFVARVTPHSILVQNGILSRDSSEVFLNRIESVDVTQGSWERMLGIGTLVLRGVGSEDIELRGLADPKAFKDAVFASLEKLQMRAL